MDKKRFIEISPIYYALSIVSYIRRNSHQSFITTALYREYSGETRDGDYDLLQHSFIMSRAISWLENQGMVQLSRDDFGPSIISPTGDFTQNFERLRTDPNLPLGRYISTSDSESWLRGALEKLNDTYQALGITENDFEESEAEWEPIPIDRGDQNLQVAIASLEETVEMVRSDNGYTANVPEERRYVYDTLSAGLKHLKEGTSTSAAYIRNNLVEPLNKLIQRFGNAALGAVGSGAKEAIKEWVKSQAQELLKWIF